MLKVQLSHSLPINKSPNRDYFKKYNLEGDWYLSEKYDGIRAIWNGEKLLTRSLREFSWVPQWFLDKLPSGFPLDGELIIPNETFGTFSSISIQKECQESHDKWLRINYLIFDTPQDHITFEGRMLLLDKKIDNLDGQIKLICFRKIKSIEKHFDVVNTKFDKVISNGGEGVMLIKSDSLYKFGKRSKMSLKYKKYHEGEAEVIQLHEGRGKYKGMLGKLECRLPNGNKFFCGTGFNDKQRNSYRLNDNGFMELVIREKDNPNIGDTITYSCMEIIKKTGVPRMSVFKTIRSDL